MAKKTQTGAKKYYRKHLSVDGKEYTLYGKTQAELDAKYIQFRNEQDSGLTHDKKPLFKAAAEEWLKNKAMTGESNRVNSKSICDLHLKPLMEMQIKKLRAADLQAIINGMATGDNKTNTVYSIRMMRNVKAAAVAIMEIAMDNYIIAKQPFKSVKIPKTEEDEGRQPVTAAQEKAIKTYTDHRMAVPALIMLYCGLRRGELLALEDNDFDFKQNVITVNKCIIFETKTGFPILKRNTKTKAGMREVPIPPVLIPILKIWKLKRNGKYICPAKQTGEYMSLSAFRRAWESYMHYLNIAAGGRDRSRSNPKIVALEPFTAHQLRHTYATMLYNANVDVLTAKKLLGHRRITTTLKIYTHLAKEKEDNSIAALNAYLADKNDQICI